MNDEEKLEIWKRKKSLIEGKIRETCGYGDILLNLFNEARANKNVKLNNLLKELDLEEEISHLKDWIKFHEKEVLVYEDKIKSLEKEVSEQESEAAKEEAELKESLEEIEKEEIEYEKKLLFFPFFFYFLFVRYFYFGSFFKFILMACLFFPYIF